MNYELPLTLRDEIYLLLREFDGLTPEERREWIISLVMRAIHEKLKERDATMEPLQKLFDARWHITLD